MSVSAQGQSIAQPASERLHFLDVARAVLLLLGIPYHAAQPFSSRAWFIHSESYSRLAELAGEFTHSFRMHAFFLVAGFFAALILRKRGPTLWLGDRAKRLIIPFLTTLLLVLPAQAMILGIVQDGSAFAGLRRMEAETRLWVAHSWFLRHLFLYCALLVLAWRVVPRLHWRIGGWTMLGGLVAGLMAWKLGVNLLVAALLARIDPTVAYDIGTFLRFVPLFALGVAICVVPQLLGAVTRYSTWGVLLALAWLTLSALLFHRDDFGLSTAAFLAPLNGLIGSWALIVVARRFLDRPSALVDYFVGGALIFYIVHMAFIFLFTGLLRGVEISPTIAWMLVSALTLAGCMLSYEAIRRIPLLNFLFSGQAWRPSSHAHQERAASETETPGGDDGGKALA